MDDKVLKAINSLDRKFDQKFDQKFNDLNKKFDENFEGLSKKLDNQFEEKFINLFNQGFEEVVRPEIEYLRKDMNTRFDSLERKFDRVAVKQLDQESELKKHDNMLKKVEHTARAA